MTDKKTLNLARQWAEWMHDNPHIYDTTSDRARAAVDLISSLPDEWVDAKELRELVDEWTDHYTTHDAYLLYRKVKALLPATPTLPTLADMSPEERADCQGMWCVTIPDRPHSTGGMMCILISSDNDTALTITPRGILHYPRNNELEPRFDLPRAWNPDGTPSSRKGES